MISAYDKEAILIGLALTYQEAPRHCLPGLVHSKFIHSKEGQLGGRPDHSYIWQAVELCHTRTSISPASVADHLSPAVREDYRPYLKTLQDKLYSYYGIYEFDPGFCEELARAVDRAGSLFQFGRRSARIAKSIETP